MANSEQTPADQIITVYTQHFYIYNIIRSLYLQ